MLTMLTMLTIVNKLTMLTLMTVLTLQGAAGKYQIAQEKTQMELDKAHQEIDILREKMERNQGDSRRVSRSTPVLSLSSSV